LKGIVVMLLAPGVQYTGVFRWDTQGVLAEG
jgi:hypothetical protein